MGRPENSHRKQQTTRWYINAYLHASGPDVLPIDEGVLNGLQFGGKRNYGYGVTQLKDTQVVDLDKLDYSQIKDGEAFLIEVVTPFVLESAYPNAADQEIPWWWKERRGELREREEKIVEQQETHRLQTVDHRQVTMYEGNRPLKTAKSGILRVGTHSKQGFGEFRVRPGDSPKRKC